jgi:elongation of very long chain fatty acids protein 7
MNNKSASEIWNYYFYDQADPRIRDRVFMGSPLLLIAWTWVYLVLVVFLRKWMRKREAFNIRCASIAYYAYMFVVSCYVFAGVLPYWIFKYNLRCEPLDRSNSEEALRVSLAGSSQKAYSDMFRFFIRWLA